MFEIPEFRNTRITNSKPTRDIATLRIIKNKKTKAKAF